MQTPPRADADPSADESPAPESFWLQALPGHRVRRLHQKLVAEFNQLVAAVGGPAGLTHLQFAALAAIDHRPGCDQATVARLIGCDKVTLGKLMDRIEARGWVLRASDPNDRRARTLRLSPDGAAVLEQLRLHVVASPIVTLPTLDTSERALLLALLGRLTMPYDEAAVPPGTDQGTAG